MNLTHLRYMVEVERQGSITKAAAALYMGQPNLSKAIKEMELELGIPIFKRSAKGVVPTEKGREFLQYAKAIIVQMDKMEELYKDSGDSRVDFQLMLPRASYITYAFTEFVNALPKTELMDIKFKETNSIEAVNAIIECEISLAIIRCESSQEDFFTSLLKEKKLRSQEIWEFEYMVLMSENSPLAGENSISTAQLDDYIEIVHGDTAVPNISPTLQKRNPRLRSHKRHIYVFERGSQFDILSSNPNTFMYVSPLPNDLLKRYGLVQRPCADNRRTLRDLLIYQNSYRLSKTDQMFLEHLHKVIDKMESEIKNEQRK